MSALVRWAITDHVGRVTLDRPDLHNAFNEVMIGELTDAIARLGESSEVRTIILSGEGKSFCAGADVNWMRRMVNYTFDENLADARVMSGMLQAIRNSPKPVIARVHGAAYGGGVGLTAACDIAVALSSAVFCLSEVKLGIIPAVISPFVLEKIGIGQARRYALTAEQFDGDQARRIGLVHETFDSVDAMDAWIARTVKTIAENGPGAVSVCKHVLREVHDRDWSQLEALTTRRISERRVSTEGQEGLKAFLEKRPPNWVSGA